MGSLCSSPEPEGTMFGMASKGLSELCSILGNVSEGEPLILEQREGKRKMFLSVKFVEGHLSPMLLGLDAN